MANQEIPVTKSNYTEIDLYSTSIDVQERKYQKMLKEQLSQLNAHSDQIKDKSYKLYKRYKSNNLYPQLRNRCCNYLLLEEKSLEYAKVP